MLQEFQKIISARKHTGPNVARPGKRPGEALVDAPGFDALADESTMSAWATITTSTPDRSEDVVEPMGVMLDNYRKNPVVLWDHGFGGINMPIGKCEDEEGNLAMLVDDDRIDACCFFAQGMAEAEQIFDLIVQKIVRATSIGFRPLEASPRSKGLNQTGLHITAWELFEWSWVVVPDNPDAIAKILDRGKLCGRPICEPLMKSLAPYRPHTFIAGRGWTPSESVRKKLNEYRRKGKEMREKQQVNEAIDEFCRIAISGITEVMTACARRITEMTTEVAQPGRTALPHLDESDPKPGSIGR